MLPLAAVEAAAFHHYSHRLPWADLLCMPLTCLIQAPTANEVHEFERKMSKRCGGDFNRNLAVVCPSLPAVSKRGIECICRCLFARTATVSSSFHVIFRCAIMSIKTEKSGGGSARTKELYELFGRSAAYLGCGEVQSGFFRFPDFLSSSKRKNSNSASRCVSLFFVFFCVLSCLIAGQPSRV